MDVLNMDLIDIFHFSIGVLELADLAWSRFQKLASSEKLAFTR